MAGPENREKRIAHAKHRTSTAIAHAIRDLNRAVERAKLLGVPVVIEVHENRVRLFGSK